MFVSLGTQRDAKATKDCIQIQVSLLMPVFVLFYICIHGQCIQQLRISRVYGLHMKCKYMNQSIYGYVISVIFIT